MELKQVLPPVVGPRPPPGLALAGAAAVIKTTEELSQEVTTWGLKHFRDEPQVRLARAKALMRSQTPAKAVEVLKTLPTTPGYIAEAALLTARLQLRHGKPRDALKTLENMGRFRKTARLWYELRAAMGLRNFELALPIAEKLSRRLADRSDMDALRVQRYRFYRTINFLGRKSRRYARVLRLLNSRREPFGGEIDRLGALVEVYQAAGMREQAARSMDRLLEYQVVKPSVLKICEEVYRAVKDQGAAGACRDLRLRLEPEPTHPSLWPKRSR
jgi:hypothetical protein